MLVSNKKRIYYYLPIIGIFILFIYLWVLNSNPETYLEITSNHLRFQYLGNSDNILRGLKVDGFRFENGVISLKKIQIVSSHDSGYYKEAKITSPLTPPKINIEFNEPVTVTELKIQDSTVVTLKFLGEFVEFYFENTTKGLVKATINLPIENMPFFIEGEKLFLDKTPLSTEFSTYKLTSKDKIIYLYSEGVENVNMIMRLDSFKKIFPLLERCSINELSFSSEDKMIYDIDHPFFHYESGIIKGNILLTGIDFFQKRFLLKETPLQKSDFISLNPGDRYELTKFDLTKDGFLIHAFTESARKIEAGKRPRLMRSILPSKLEQITEMPSNQKIWAGLVFIVSQILFLRDSINKYIIKKTKDE